MVKRSPAKDGRAIVVVAQREGSEELELVGACSSRTYPYVNKEGQIVVKKEHPTLQKMLKYPEGTVFDRMSRTEWTNLQESKNNPYTKLSIGRQVGAS